MPDSDQVVRHSRHEMQQYERTAAEAIDAGNLVMTNADGDLINHDTDGARPTRLLVAIDDRDRGMAFGDTYTAGDDATKHVAPSGGGLHLPLAAGEAVTDGVPLVSNGAGALRESATDADGNYTELDAAVAYTIEDVDNSGGTDPTAVATEVVN